jgi:hypothetical protein
MLSVIFRSGAAPARPSHELGGTAEGMGRSCLEPNAQISADLHEP